MNFRARRKDYLEIGLGVLARRVEGGEGAVVALRGISRQKAMELQLREVNDQPLELVMLDGLTGIANRRCFDLVLAKGFRRTWRDMAGENSRSCWRKPTCQGADDRGTGSCRRAGAGHCTSRGDRRDRDGEHGGDHDLVAPPGFGCGAARGDG